MNLPKDDQLLRGRVRILWSLINLGLFPFYLLLSNSSTSSTIFAYRIEITVLLPAVEPQTYFSVLCFLINHYVISITNQQLQLSVLIIEDSKDHSPP